MNWLAYTSQTIQAIKGNSTLKLEKQFKKPNYHGEPITQKSKRKSLGWLPFKQSAIKHITTQTKLVKGLKSTLQLSLAKGQKLVIEPMGQLQPIALPNQHTRNRPSQP